MKNTALIIMGICLAICFSSPAFATNITGTGQTIPDSTAGLTGLTGIDLSPKVTVSYFGSDEQYEMCGVNSAGKIEYGVNSASNFVYQHEATITDGAAVITTLDADTGEVSNWTVMGGGASGSGS